MLARLKRIPLFAKIAIGCLGVLLVCATVYLLQSHRKRHREPICCAPPPEYLERLEKREKLDKDKTEYAQLLNSVSQCQVQLNEALSKQAGRKYHQPECVAYMRQWMTRGAQLEAELQRVQPGELPPANPEADGQQNSQSQSTANPESRPR